jgi:hypothetical protein
MIAQVLDLTPSMTGWYYASVSQRYLQAHEARPNPRTTPIPVAPADPVCLGYGPDGRPRLASTRPRVWYLG